MDLQGSLRALVGAALVAGVLAAPGAAHAANAPAASKPARLDVPFDKYTLPNGLTVILHEDHALPLVTVNVMVKVGSRHEEAKRTGFAHLFEHLMFMGTHRVPTKMFDAWMEVEGGWNNAWTSEDRTDYFDVAPAHALPLLLWMEADRFLSLDDDMDLPKLNAQRDVVRNERRQTSENTPYGKVELRLPELMYPPGHPYHHPVIGSHEDLQAASVDDVKGFFQRWYVPNNASLVVAGDFNPKVARDLIARYFGALPAGQVPEAPAAPSVRLKGVVRETIQDNVQLPKLVMAWHSPPHFGPGDADLDLLASILDEGKASRLYKALIYDKALAQEVSASQQSGEHGSRFVIEAIARPGVELSALEAAIDAELARIRTTQVSQQELDRARNQFETDFVARLEATMARALLLNSYETFRGDPGFAERDLQRYREATRQSLQHYADTILDPGARVILHVVPAKAAPAGKEAAR